MHNVGRKIRKYAHFPRRKAREYNGIVPYDTERREAHNAKRIDNFAVISVFGAGDQNLVPLPDELLCVAQHGRFRSADAGIKIVCTDENTHKNRVSKNGQSMTHRPLSVANHFLPNILLTKGGSLSSFGSAGCSDIGASAMGASSFCKAGAAGWGTGVSARGAPFTGAAG